MKDRLKQLGVITLDICFLIVLFISERELLDIELLTNPILFAALDFIVIKSIMNLVQRINPKKQKSTIILILVISSVILIPITFLESGIINCLINVIVNGIIIYLSKPLIPDHKVIKEVEEYIEKQETKTKKKKTK